MYSFWSFSVVDWQTPSDQRSWHFAISFPSIPFAFQNFFRHIPFALFGYIYHGKIIFKALTSKPSILKAYSKKEIINRNVQNEMALIRNPYNQIPHPTMKVKTHWAKSWENLFMPFANNKDADQPARCLDSITPIQSEIRRLWLTSVAEQTSLSPA